jgi:hypothetical protein
MQVRTDKRVVHRSVRFAPAVSHLREQPHCHTYLAFPSHYRYQLGVDAIVSNIPSLFLHPSENLAKHDNKELEVKKLEISTLHQCVDMDMAK